MRAREVPAKFQVAFSFSGMEREFVRSIADAVELKLGSPHVFFDEWFEHHVAGHDADRKLQRIYETGCELVVVCVSETYARKAWTQAEHEVIRARLMQARTEADPRQVDRILPIRVGDGNVHGIPLNAIVPDVRARTPEQVAELILARLHLVAGAAPPDPAPGPSWPATAPVFPSRLADRASEWPAVVRLLSADAMRRVLVFTGPSNFGKSALLGEARRYARDCLKVPVAYLDFKDTMLLTEHNLLRELKTRTGDALPGFAQAAQTDRWTLLQALRRLSRPLLLVLDTYEKVTEARDLADWLETQLMPEVEDCPELRVLIAGQKGPDLSRARWRDQADALELDRIHSAETWTAWIRQQNPVVEEKHVQGIVLALEGVPGTISGLLVTLARRAQPT